VVAVVDLARHFEMKTAVGTTGGRSHEKPGFLRRAAAFFDVAAGAGGDDVVPGVETASGFGDDVVEGQIVAAVAAVLTGMAVAVQNIAAGQGNFAVGDIDVVAQANHRRLGQPRSQDTALIFNMFCFLFEQKHNRPPPACNVERFKGSIEHQHFAHRRFKNRTRGVWVGLVDRNTGFSIGFEVPIHYE
jgi:hypothetical protein